MVFFELFCNSAKTIDVWAISFDKRFFTLDKSYAC
jgi:hypothetical protein